MSPRLLLIAALTLLASFGTALAEKRVALVIGNSAYSKVASLPNPTNDAASIAAMLRAAGFGSVDLKLNLSASDMRKALRDFGGKSREADVAVLYYAGHGIELDGINYLVPVDAALEADADVMDEAVALDRVLFAVEPAKNTRLVILDACRDNPFAKRMKRTMASRSIGRGLAKVEPSSPNTVIAFAAKAGSTASDGDARNSPFATALVEHLPKPGLDLRRAFGFVRDDVLKYTANRQEPYVYGSLGGEDVPLVPAKPVATGLSNDQQIAVRRDYELALQAGDRDAWEAFLQIHPEGFYANLARVQLKKLPTDQTTSTKLTVTSDSAGQPQSPATPPTESTGTDKQTTANPIGGKTASLTPTSIDPSSKTELIKSLQLELRRVGCATTAPNGNWDRASQQSLAQFNKYAQTSFDARVASVDAYDVVKTKSDRVCPLTCPQGHRIDGGHCVRVVRTPPAEEMRPQSRKPDAKDNVVPKQQASGQVFCNSQGCRQVAKGCRIVSSRNPTGTSTVNQYEKCD